MLYPADLAFVKNEFDCYITFSGLDAEIPQPY